MKKGLLVLWIVMGMMLVNSATSYDFTFDLAESELPFDTQVQLYAAGNTSVEVTYDEFLSGPAILNFINTTEQYFTVNVVVPYTWERESVSNVTFGNQSFSFYFNIVNDIEFDLDLRREYCFVHEDYAIENIAPLNTTVSMTINDVLETTDIGMFIFTPANAGTYTVETDFTFMNRTKTLSAEFNVYEHLSCSISSRDIVEENQTINFASVINGGVGAKVYDWDFDNSKKSKEHSQKSVYRDPGTYIVKLKVTDSENYKATCSKEITVTEKLYDITIVLADNMTGDKLGDANVTVENTTKKTNINGKVTFYDLAEDDYDLEIAKKGYMEYDEKVEVGVADTVYINISKEPEAVPSVPQVILISPEADYQTKDSPVTFSFKVISDSPVSECILLANYIDHRGYKIKATKEDVAINQEVKISADISGGEYKWCVQCANDEGENKSYDRYISIDSVPVAAKETTIEVKEEPKVYADTQVFDDAVAQINKFQSLIKQSNRDIKQSYQILEYESLLADHITDIKKLKKEIINLESLH